MMPRKVVPKVAQKPTCDLCCDMTEKDQETLQCERECKCTIHRLVTAYCASVTKRHYEKLKKGSVQFVCQWCSLKSTSATIQQLQLEVASLKSELAATKATLATLQNQPTDRTQSYASVARKASNRNKKQQQRRPPRSQSTPTTESQTSSVRMAATFEATSKLHDTTAATYATSVKAQKPRVKVEGAHKVWATHPHATVKTIENVIARFCSISEGLRIRRKTHRNESSGKTSWWFIIHGNENVLCELNEKWDCVHLQTSWILKPCTKPVDTNFKHPNW